MERVAIDELDDAPGPSSVKRRVGDSLGCEHLAANYYELDPGESFAFGYHAHSDQEEVFYVVDGTVTFETEADDVTVSAGELIRFAPGEYQRGVNEGSERAAAMAIGAPAETGESELLRECPTCGRRTPQRIVRVDDGLATECLECDAETGRFHAG